MSRDDTYLLDVLESARAAIEYLKGKSWDDFRADMLCQDAVIRRLEIIGEAARRISAETQQRYPHLPWRAMRETRNVVIHEYDAVELDTIWDILQNDLPALVSELEQIIPPEE
jgi:uncharacterized protein with HEPN domain